MYKSITIIFIILSFIVIAGHSQTTKFVLTGEVESIRKDNLVTILFKEKPVKEEYLVIEDNFVIGKITIININALTENNRIEYRVLAEFSLKERTNTIKAGSFIALLKEDEKKEAINPTGAIKKEESIYKKIIFTDIDCKDMILIPEGKFIFGSNTGEKDETPEQIIKLDDFYIDKYEVSNSDYYIFVNRSNSKPPISWINGKYKKGEDNFPVMVSYYEAVKYADWAGKRLPTEEEWEKAARGTGMEIFKNPEGYYYIIEKPIIYPWGNKFDPLKTNSLEFWESKNIGEEVKNKYTKGLLPVYNFNDIGNSSYGAVNMSGNASEWTSSWYNAYKNSKHSSKMYGKQVKVIRGGSWFNSKFKVRATNREIGGIPNLYNDNIAGFRCVKDPTIIDRKN
jgi:formylglycine-generating enzyme required for sulfatase activity